MDRMLQLRYCPTSNHLFKKASECFFNFCQSLILRKRPLFYNHAVSQFFFPCYLFTSFLRNCFTAYVAFKNNTDVRTNTTIANNTGCRLGYDSAQKLFRQRRIFCFIYVCMRGDQKNDNSVKVCTNLYGEIKSLGKFPWVFELPK